MSDSARARRHPRAIAIVWLWFAIWGLILAWPAAAAVGQEFRANADGDAPLFRPGAIDLLDFLWLARGVLMTGLGHVMVLAPIAILGATIPLAILLARLADRTRLEKPTRTIGELVIFEIGAFLIQAVALWGALELAVATSVSLSASFGEVRADMSGVAVFALGIVVVLFVSIYRDLASAALVRSEDSIGEALRIGGRALAVRPFALSWAWLWRSAVGMLLVVAGTWLSVRFSGKSGLFLIALALVHQAAVAWRVAWRASWLAASMRGVIASAQT
ncbi:MAG: hypothetical protein ACRELY_11070 [Polyangiaceae bacterium]